MMVKIFNVLITLTDDGATSLDASVTIAACRFECLLQVIKHLSRKLEIADLLRLLPEYLNWL